MNLTKFIISIFLVIFISCSEKVNNGSKLDLSITVLKIYSWINLMPGSSPSFHITGEVRIKNQDKDIAANLILQEIIIYRNNEEIIKFIPLFKYENNPGNLDTNDQINYNIKPGEEKNFSFNTNGNIKVNKELQDTQTADAVLKFSSAGKLYDYRIENIKVERIY